MEKYSLKVEELFASRTDLCNVFRNAYVSRLVFCVSLFADRVGIGETVEQVPTWFFYREISIFKGRSST